MQITIKGKKFDVTPVPASLGAVLMREPAADPFDRRVLFDWDCRTQSAGNVNKDAQDGKLTAPVLAVFYVSEKADPGRKDPDETAKMQILTMATLKLPTMNRLRALTEARFGKHELPVNMTAMDWLKPFARFRLYANVSYKWFRARMPGTKLHFYIGLPHEVWLDAAILAFCNMIGVLKGLKEGGKTLKTGEVVGISDKPESGEARKDHLEEERDSLRRKEGKSSKDRLEEIDKELDGLEELFPSDEDEGADIPPSDGSDTKPFDWELKPPTHSGD